MAVYDERQFTAEVKSWVDKYIQENPESPFSRCETEEPVDGYRSDFTLYRAKSKTPALMGEVKLPDAYDGGSPYQKEVIENAFLKASIKQSKFFFTWNINRLVLWKTQDENKPLFERDQEVHVLRSPIRSREQLADNKNLIAVKDFFLGFIEDYSKLFEDKRDYHPKPIDRRIIETIENLLDFPVHNAAKELAVKWEKDIKFRLKLHEWMRDEAGYAVSDTALDDNLRDSAKLGTYLLMLKIVFYKHLRRTFSELPPMDVRDDVNSANEIQDLLNRRFSYAMDITGDYETIFTPSFGDKIALCTDDVVTGWKNLMLHLDDLDFSHFDHDVIGALYEELLSTHERHQFGQHFTRLEIVDLINAFCIRNETDKVLDPACGGGTFLVRAYARKKHLSEGQRSHRDLLNEIYGIDIAKLPAELSVINLAIRELVREKNYPLVIKNDFFEVMPHDSPFSTLIEMQSLGANHTIAEDMPEFDAIVGNPPYIRQEDLGADGKERIRTALFKDYERHVPQFSGRSDIYVYFWPHAARMLKEGGYIGFITSTHWLDSDYGFKLQKFLLSGFKIVAVIESAVEPLFSVARIRTVVTIVQKCKDETERIENKVKFVRLMKPLQQFLNESHENPLIAAENVFQDIESADCDIKTEVMRIRVVKQKDLLKDGTPPGALEYKGWKWGIYLRAPNVFFDILNIAGDKILPLSEIADVKYGIKSGADSFFYPRDITDKLSDKELAEFGLTRSKTKKFRVIQAGDKSVHVVESLFVKPVAFNPMEISSISYTKDHSKRRVILIDRDIHGSIKRKRIWKYIKWGESKKYHENLTCASRIRPKKGKDKGKVQEWYELKPRNRGAIFWVKTHQYRHIAPLNEDNLFCNCRLYDIFAVNYKTELACILNSNLQVLFKNLFGRISNEGKLDTEVIDAKMMLTVNPSAVKGKIRKEMVELFNEIKGKPVGKVSDEILSKQRRRIDELLLEAIGFESKKEREKVLEELYVYLIEHQERERDWEIQAVRKRTEGKRKQKVTPRQMAEEIWSVERKNENIHFLLSSYLPPNTPCKMITVPKGAVVDQQDMFAGGLEDGSRIVIVDDESVELPSPYHAALLEALAEIGIHGDVSIPISKEKAGALLFKAERHKKKVDKRLEKAVSDRIRDEKFAGKVLDELLRIFRVEG